MAGETILIVEDEGILAAHLQDLLSTLGYVVLEPAATGRSAVAAVAAHQPDLVLMDIELAGPIDGIGAAEKIRSVWDVPIVFLTGYAQDAVLQQAKVAAPYGYLVKPVAERELAATLEMALYRRTLDHQLRTSEAKYRTLVENIPGAVCCREVESPWRVRYVSEGVLGVTGWPVADFLEDRLDWEQLVVSDDRAIVEEAVQAAVLRNEPFAIEYRILHPDGGVRWVRETGRRASDNGADPACLEGVILDITDRKRAEMTLRESERQQAEAERLAALGRMAARVAHEINNPLAGIRNAFRLVRDAVPLHHPDHDMVERIEREIERIANIVRQMYTLYSPRAERVEDICVANVIQDVLLMLEPLRREYEAEFDASQVPLGLTVRISEGALCQVLYNLVANAVETSPRAGKVMLAADLAKDSIGPDLVRLSVRDYGKGIAQELGVRVFEPFLTTKADDDTKRGLGMGLSVVKGLVESFGGRIEFESTPGRGTVFRVFLLHGRDVRVH